MTGVLTVDLKQLNKNIGPAIEYLRSRLDEPIKVKGSQVKFADTSARATKQLLDKFVRQLRLEGYRILVVHPGLIEVRASEKEKVHPLRVTHGAIPSAWETAPTNGTLLPPGIIRPRKRTKREMKRAMRGL